jgi:hypothetical protein
VRLIAKQRPDTPAQLALPPVLSVEPVVHVAPPAVNVTVVQPGNDAKEPTGAPYKLHTDSAGKPCLTWSAGSLVLRPAMKDFLAELNETGTATARMEYVTELLESVAVLKEYVSTTSKRRSDGKADYAAPMLKGRIGSASAAVPSVQ